MQNIYVFSGFSGAGKDTCADWLTFYRNAKKVKFAAPGKRALAFILGVDPDLFEDRGARLAIAPNCQGRSYLQVLIDFYHHRDLVIGADLFAAQSYEAMAKVLRHGSDLVISDMRNHDEVDVLLKLNRAYHVTTIPIWVYGGVKMSSDDKSVDLLDGLSTGTRSDVLTIYGNCEGSSGVGGMLANLATKLAL